MPKQNLRSRPQLFDHSGWVIGEVLLWRRKEVGFVTGLGLLFQASMLFIGLIIFLLLQPFLTTAPFVLADVVVLQK